MSTRKLMFNASGKKVEKYSMTYIITSPLNLMLALTFLLCTLNAKEHAFFPILLGDFISKGYCISSNVSWYRDYFIISVLLCYCPGRPYYIQNFDFLEKDKEYRVKSSLIRQVSPSNLMINIVFQKLSFTSQNLGCLLS